MILIINDILITKKNRFIDVTYKKFKYFLFNFIINSINRHLLVYKRKLNKKSIKKLGFLRLI